MAGVDELTAAWLDRQAAAPGATTGVLDALGRSEVLATAYGGRYLSRPVFLARHDWEALARDLVAYYELACDLPDRLCGGDVSRFARLVGMVPAQVAAVERCRSDRPPLAARADMYRSGGRFKVLEYNIHSAAGGFEIAELNRAALEEPTLAAFVAERGLDYVDTLARMVDVMTAALAGADLPSRPKVALVDWPSSFPSLEPRLRNMARQLGRLGVDALACHAGQLRQVGDRLVVGDQPIDVVYRFFLVEDLLESPDAPDVLEPIFRAVERGSVVVYMGYEAELIGCKPVLAMLCDPANGALLSAAERDLMDRLAPWTRRLEGPTVERDGELVDAVDLLRAERERLILKPTLMTGGSGVAAGWTMPAEAWDAAVATAVQGGFVVQERVVPDAEPFLDEDGGISGWALNWGVFCLGDGYGGAYIRADPDRDCGVISLKGGAWVGSCFHEP